MFKYMMDWEEFRKPSTITTGHFGCLDIDYTSVHKKEKMGATASVKLPVQSMQNLMLKST